MIVLQSDQGAEGIRPGLDSSLGNWSSLGAGTILRAARVARGLSLGEVAIVSGLSEPHLMAIEAGQFERFLTPVGATGMARGYASAVGVSEAWIEALVRQGLDRPSELACAAKGPDAADKVMRMMIGGTIAAGCVAMALLFS